MGLLSGFRKLRPSSGSGHRSTSSSSEQQQSPSRFCCSSSTLTANDNNRRGMTFLGFCDYRIAAVLLNILHMVLSLILEICEAVEWDRNSFEEPPVLTMCVCIFSGMGVYGALHFSKVAMYISSIGLIFLWYIYLLEQHVFGLTLICFIIFVHVVFILEMTYGIMTKETYATEEYIDKDGRIAIETAHSLSVDIGGTAVEFAGEVANEVDRQSSGVVKQTDNGGIISDRKLEEC